MLGRNRKSTVNKQHLSFFQVSRGQSIAGKPQLHLIEENACENIDKIRQDLKRDLEQILSLQL